MTSSLAQSDQEEWLGRLDAVIAALGHPARRQIVMTIHFRGGSMSAGEIAGRFAHSWPTTTKHLAALTRSQLLRVDRLGRTRHYSLDYKVLAVLQEWARWFDHRPDAE